MKIVVCVKHVPDTAATITVAGGAGYEDADMKFIVNPYDEYGLEEAVSLVEKQGGEVVVLTVGRADAVSSIRNALAMGAHRAILVKTKEQFLCSTLTAEALKAVMDKDGLPDMIFTGQGSVDTESFQTQYRLARSLGMPVVNEVSSLTLEGETALATRESGNGNKEEIEMQRPCVIGTAKGLNQPRYPKFPDIMKAKKKKISEMNLSDLGIDPSQERMTIEKLDPAPERSACRQIEGSVDDQVTKLIRILKKDEKVL